MATTMSAEGSAVPVLDDPERTLAVIVLTRGRPDLLGPCLEALVRAVPGWPGNVLLVVQEHGPDSSDTRALAARTGLRVLVLHDPANPGYAAAHNAIVQRLEDDGLRPGYLCLLNNDVLVDEGALLGLAKSLDAGLEIVGAKLRYPNGLLQHYGVAFTRDYYPFHVLRGQPSGHPVAQEGQVTPAVTFALVGMALGTWQDVGGLCEDYRYGYEDTHFCLEARLAGTTCGVVPDFGGVHLESQTAGRSDLDAVNEAVFVRHWHLTGRIYDALGVYPTWRTPDILRATKGPLQGVAPGGRP